MHEPFPFVEVPDEFGRVVGTAAEGTRLYRRDGPQEDAAAWFDFIAERFDATLSPGGVGVYCPVSRAAVYKRIKEGRLTMFAYHVTWSKTTFFGKNRVLRERPYGCIPTSELKAWRAELEERAVRNGELTEEELDGLNPDWHGEFLEWPVTKERVNLLDALKKDGIPLSEFFVEVVKAAAAAAVGDKITELLKRETKARKLEPARRAKVGNRKK